MEQHEQSTYELNEIKGQQMVQMLRDGIEPKQSATQETIITTKNVQESDIITDLQERLRFANETIVMLMDQANLKQNGDDVLNISDNLSEGQDSSLSLRYRLEELEQQKIELQDENEKTKLKARDMLAEKDSDVKKLKASLEKYYNYLGEHLSPE